MVRLLSLVKNPGMEPVGMILPRTILSKPLIQYPRVTVSFKENRCPLFNSAYIIQDHNIFSLTKLTFKKVQNTKALQHHKRHKI